MYDRESVGLKQAITGREDEFPILARALANATQVKSTTIEWDRSDGVSWFNFTQIFRHPFGETRTATVSGQYDDAAWILLKQRRLTEHLLDVEKTLELGTLHEEIRYRIDPETNELYSFKYTTMGGSKFYLGRDLEENDFLALHILQDTIYRSWTGPDVDGREGEFLTELSLAVVPSSVAALAGVEQ